MASNFDIIHFIGSEEAGMLTPEQRSQFDELGYVVVPDIVPQSVVDDVLGDCAEISAGLTEAAVRNGTAPAELLDAPLARQVIELTRLTGRGLGQHFDISFPVRGPLSDATPINLREGMFGFLTSEPLLDVVESVVGPEVFCNPVQHLRLKVPCEVVPAEGAGFLNATVPWHQDLGVVAAEAEESHILTVWSPLNSATAENGCLQVIPGSHRRDLLAHCMQTSSNQYGIPEDVVGGLGSVVTLEMEAGDILLLSQRTVHGSLDNKTADQLRISFDLRYQPAGEPTGRPLFDGFLARSAAAPESVLSSWADWTELWEATRRRLPSELDPTEFFRWGPGDVCA
jgi:phytanoyl-CoA hydroxylase